MPQKNSNYLRNIHVSIFIGSKTTEDMLREIEKHFENCDTYISMAAIGDIQFKTKDGKLKKEALSDALDIKKSPGYI